MTDLFTKTIKVTDFSRLNKLIYGFPKSGKTTLAAQMKSGEKEPFFITTEDGHGALELYAKRIRSWQDFLNLSEYMKKHAPKMQEKFSCIVVDLVTELDTLCTEHLCKQHNVKFLSDLDFGKGWFLQKQEFQSQVGALFQILPCVFIAHTTEKELQWNNEKIKVQSPSMAKACLEYINGKVDAIMFISPANSKTEHPKVVMKQSTTAIAGCRFPHMTKEFKLDPANMSASYQKIQDAFAQVNTPVKETP